MKTTRDALALLEIPHLKPKKIQGHGWRPREVDCVKINTDASISMDALNSGAGGVIRSPTDFIGAWRVNHTWLSLIQ
jgi:hypothetical protein